MITKGGLNTVIRSLAIEYAKEGIRFNAVDLGRRGHTTAQGCAPGSSNGKAGTEDGYEGERYCRRSSLSIASRASNQRDHPRRWRLSRWPLVSAGRSVMRSAASPPPVNEIEGAVANDKRKNNHAD